MSQIIKKILSLRNNHIERVFKKRKKVFKKKFFQLAKFICRVSEEYLQKQIFVYKCEVVPTACPSPRTKSTLKILFLRLIFKQLKYIEKIFGGTKFENC